MECKYCGSVDFYEKEKIDSLGRPHTQIRCNECDGYKTTKKRPENIGKTKEDYRNEYMANQHSTEKQVNYIKFLCVTGKNQNVEGLFDVEYLENITNKKITISKLEAFEIINELLQVVKVEHSSGERF